MTDHEQNDNFLDEQPDHRDSPSHQVDPTIDFDTPSTQSRASAPTHDDNGYIFIPPTPQSSIDNSADRASEQIENIRNILDDLAYETESKLQQAYSSASKVVAEADSSTGPLPSSSSVPAVPSAKPTAQQTADHNKQSTSKACAICPYYMLACDKLSKVDVPPKVRDLLLWSCPKTTGAVFTTVLVLLISLALCSLFTVLGTVLLLALTGLGAYRFYLMILFRIKGTYDDTFDKLSAKDISLPKEKVQRLVTLLETDVNRLANKLKAILLWDNICNSAIAFIGFYSVYCLGSWFNTLTLLILAHVSAFTLPKVYQVYKLPIDQGLEKATNTIHLVSRQISAKLPFLHGKRKTQ